MRRDDLQAELMARFRDRAPRLGAAPAPLAVFPPEHPEVGEVTIEDSGADTDFSVTVSVGAAGVTHFHNYDVHLDPVERGKRLTREVMWFLEALFADRLVLWCSTDGRNAGWRERGQAGLLEPLVLDNRTYRRYLWSGPLAPWQAVPTIIANGRIRDERDYTIVSGLLEGPDTPGLDQRDRHVLRRLAADFERKGAG